MPDPLLPELDESTEEAVFAALAAILMADPVLQNVVKTWEVLDGTSKTLLPPTPSQMPYCRLIPYPSAMRLAEAGAWELDFAIVVTLATAGLHRADHLNLWGAFRRALGYQQTFRDVDVAQYLRTAGATCYTIQQPVFGPRPLPTPDKATPAQDLYGTAVVAVKLILPM